MYGITGSEVYHFVNLMAPKRHSIVMHSPVAADLSNLVSLKAAIVLASADHRTEVTPETKILTIHSPIATHQSYVQ